MVSGRSQNPQVLLVEDNMADAVLAREVLSDGPTRIDLHHVQDGQEAMDFLRRVGPYHGAPRPDLILLDINMPRKNGLQTLAEIRDDPNLRHMVVVVLTTSSAEPDVRRAYHLNVNAFITKPMELQRFAGLVRTMQDFFFSCVTLPDNDAV